MAHVDARAKCAFAGIQVWLDRVERRVLHDHDHDGGRQDRRQCHILETAGEMLRQHQETERTCGPDRYRLHGLSLGLTGGDELNTCELGIIALMQTSAAAVASSGSILLNCQATHGNETTPRV